MVVDAAVCGEKSMRICHLLAVFVLLCTSSVAFGMDVKWVDESGDMSRFYISMRGPIEKGDYEKLEFYYVQPMRTQEELMRNSVWASSQLVIESPGGDIEEALKIAKLINSLYRTVSITGDCASACAVLYLAGATRVAIHGRVGLHRPYFQQERYKNMPLAQAKAAYEKSEKVFRERMLEYGLPQHLYDRLLRTSSKEIYWLTNDDIIGIGLWPPYMEERIIAKCGAMPKKTGEHLVKFADCARATKEEGIADVYLAFRKSKGLDRK